MGVTGRGVLYGEAAAESARLLLAGVGGTSKHSTLVTQRLLLEEERGGGGHALVQGGGVGEGDLDGGILCTRIGEMMVGLCLDGREPPPAHLHGVGVGKEGVGKGGGAAVNGAADAKAGGGRAKAGATGTWIQFAAPPLRPRDAGAGNSSTAGNAGVLR